jgi:chorismate synthase
MFPVPYSLFPSSLPLYNEEAMIRFSTAGESHGEALIALVSGLPAGVPVDLEFVNR